MRRGLAIAVLLLGLGALHGCNCSDNGTGGDMDNSDLSGTVIASDGGCTASGQACAGASECCSGVCSNNICLASVCGGSAAQCKIATDCCNLNCQGGTCSTQQCVSDGQPCTAGGAACCSTSCVNGTCQALNTQCKTAGNSCGGDGECCSMKCLGGQCAAPSSVSYCTQAGDICFHPNECCTGLCNIAAGATAGTCTAIGGGCAVDGTSCNGCSGCCSSFCAPYGTSASKICQPASGCHVTGDLCLKDSDCCGGDPTQIGTIPGGGLIKCVPVPGNPTIGTCSAPNPSNCPSGQSCGNACVPEGDVCHYKGNGGCSSNAIRDDCCGAPGNKGMCQLDKLGIPRCYGLTACVMAGGACASSADCCNNAPCLPDAMGHLHCGSMCVAQGGVCTTTSDCCTGLQCTVPPGSLQGTCTIPNAPTDGSAPPDLAGVDLAGQPPPDLSTPPLMCALYGQTCSTTVSCCANSGMCLRPYLAGSVPCAAGNTDCTCYTPLM